MKIYEWFLLGMGIAIYLYTWRLAAGKITWWWSSNPPNGGDVLFGIICGGVAAILFPIILPIVLWYEHKIDIGFRNLMVNKVLYLPREHRRDER